MGDRLKVSQQEIEGMATKIRNKNQDAASFLNQLQQTIDEAHNIWEGASSDKFHSEFGELKKELQKKLDEYLNSLANALKEVAKALKEADEQVAKKVDLKMK